MDANDSVGVKVPIGFTNGDACGLFIILFLSTPDDNLEASIKPSSPEPIPLLSVSKGGGCGKELALSIPKLLRLLLVLVPIPDETVDLGRDGE